MQGFEMNFQEAATQTDRKPLRRGTIHQFRDIELTYSSFLEVGQSELDLVEAIDNKFNFQDTSIAYVFVGVQGFIVVISILISFIKYQLDLHLTLFMWALFRTDKLTTLGMRYYFILFIINIFLDINWICQINGVNYVIQMKSWESQQYDVNSTQRFVYFSLQKLLIPIKVLNPSLYVRYFNLEFYGEFQQHGKKYLRFLRIFNLYIDFMYKTLIKRAFSSSVNFKLYYPEGHAKVFKIRINQSAAEVRDLILKEEDGRFKNFELLMGQTDYTREEIPFVEFLIHNPVSLIIDGRHFAYQVDSSGAANYIFNNQHLEDKYNELEIPFQDSFVISKFLQTFEQNQETQNKSLYTPTELKKLLKQTLQVFAEKNATQTQFWQTYQEVAARLELELKQKENEVKKIQDESKVEGYRLLRKWIIISLAQYFFLFYLTYGLYSWNVSEPISYLLAQTLETIGIYYFLRRGFAFRQSTLFAHRYSEVFRKRIDLKNNSTNFLAETQHARDKLNMINNKLIYATTTV